MSETVHIVEQNTTIQSNVRFLNTLFPEPRNYSICLWDQLELPASQGENFALVLNHPAALRRMFRFPLELNMGEAYIYGDFDIQGDIYSAFDLVDQLISRITSLGDVLAIWKNYIALPRTDHTSLSGRGPLELSGEIHSKERDARAVRYHYNVGNDFYSLWLGKHMLYSCAYFPTGIEDLDTAQQKKMEHICRKLHLQPGEHLLDIGCGWGSLVMYAAEKYGVNAVGVTISERQAEFAQKRVLERGLQDKVRIEMEDYRDLKSEQFDKVVSVGMFEHVGRSHLPEYFTHVYRLLKPGGLFLNHGISARRVTPVIAATDRLSPRQLPAPKNPYLQGRIQQSVLGPGSFSQRYIFPDGELVLVSDANLVAESAGFEVRDVENLREHYALTIRNWVRNIERNHTEIVQLTDEVTYRTWRLYLANSVHGFESGTISVNQSLLSKPVQGKTILPLSRADLYQ